MSLQKSLEDRINRLEKVVIINTIILITIAPDAIVSFLEKVVELI